jgi:HEPN domain-containing protein
MWRRHDEELRRAAVMATMRVMNQTPPSPPYYSDLLGLADALLREGRYELAVVVAQMACEVVVEQTLTPFLKDKRPKTFDLTTGVINSYMRWTRDRNITKQSFWKPYCRHAQRRHDVVHRGARVSPSEARDSTTTARQFVEHVDQVRRGMP